MKSCLHESCTLLVTNDLVACRSHFMELPNDIRKGLVRAKAHMTMRGKVPVEVPEDKPLMKVLTEQANHFWKGTVR